MTEAATETARRRLEEAVIAAARGAHTFPRFVVAALHALTAEPKIDPVALQLAVRGPDWARLVEMEHCGEDEDDPVECPFTEWAEAASQLERYVLDSAILIYRRPGCQGMTSGSLELRTFVAPDGRGYLYWVGDGELTDGEMWFGYESGDEEAMSRAVSAVVSDCGGFGGAIVLPELPEVEEAAKRTAEAQGTTPWNYDLFDGMDPRELDDELGDEVAFATGADREVVRQAIRDIVKSRAPEPPVAWAIVHAFYGPPPRRVDELYEGDEFSWVLWPPL